MIDVRQVDKKSIDKIDRYTSIDKTDRYTSIDKTNRYTSNDKIDIYTSIVRQVDIQTLIR